jgi:hypothetical protein
MGERVRRVTWCALQGVLVLGSTRSAVAQTCPLPARLDFDGLAPLTTCIDATSYLAGLGVTLTTPNTGAIPLVCPAGGGNGVAIPDSTPNFFLMNPAPGHNNDSMAYTLHFCAPLASFTFVRTAQVAGTSGPVWTATAFDAQGQVVGTPVGEPSITSSPGAQTFTITGEGITSVTVTANNFALATLNNPPLDTFTFTRVVDCALQTSAASYGTGQTVVLASSHIANHAARALPIELKFWLRLPGFSPVSLANVGADGTFVLPVGFDSTTGPLSLFPITAGLPRGAYEIGCRALEPVTGALLGDGRAPFTVQ